MSLQVTKRYYWMVLTEEGSLLVPKSNGFSYEYYNINDTAPFDNEEEALLAAKDFHSKDSYVHKDYVLHCEYRFSKG